MNKKAGNDRDRKFVSNSSRRTVAENSEKNMAYVVSTKLFGGLLKCLISILLVAVITGIMVAGYLAITVLSKFNNVEGVPDLHQLGRKETSRFYIKDENGNFKEDFVLEGTRSIWADFDEIPEYMRWAVIAIEDHRFYQHKGVDWRRTAAAAVNYVLRFDDDEFGGSTITQQVIKNATNDNKAELSRKIREIFRAQELEKSHYTKDEILEAYLNLLPLSANVTGVGAAANYYFDKDVSELTLAECAVIAGITQNPSKFNPYMHPENVRNRQRVVLQAMYQHGFIGEDEYVQAFNQEIEYKNGMKTVAVNNYYADYVIETVSQDLQKSLGISSEYAIQMIYSGGLNIYSAEDRFAQNALENIQKKTSNFLIRGQESMDDNHPESGITILDYDGRIHAVAGHSGEKTANRVANTATERHNTGSAMKPIASYGQAIEKNLVTYSTVIPDEYIMFEGREFPQNYDGRYGDGVLKPISYGIKQSLNTLAVRTVSILGGGSPYAGAETSLNFLRDTLGLYNLETVDKQPNDATLSMTLGELTYGVSTVEMAGAYQTFGNGGIFNTPFCYYKVTRRTNNEEMPEEVVLQARPDEENGSYNDDLYTIGRRAFSEDTAYIMNQLLQEVVRPGAGGSASGTVVPGHTTFAKTGTSNDNKDVYFAGGTAHYIATSWYGYKHFYDEEAKELIGPRSMNSTERAMAKSMWVQIMSELHEGLPRKSFEITGGAVQKTYCYKTGYLASSHCTQTSVGYYRSSNIPRECTTNDHLGLPVETDENGQLMSSTSSASETVTSTEPSGIETVPPITATTPSSNSDSTSSGTGPSETGGSTTSSGTNSNG